MKEITESIFPKDFLTKSIKIEIPLSELVVIRCAMSCLNSDDIPEFVECLYGTNGTNAFNNNYPEAYNICDALDNILGRHGITWED